MQGETEEIGKLLEKTMMEKYGPAALNEHFMIMDTICDATQERQDAVYDMTGKQVRDLSSFEEYRKQPTSI